MSRKEIEEMFGLSDLKQTRVYQEGRQEGARAKSLELIPVLLRLGLSLEDTAKELGLSLEEVRTQLTINMNNEQCSPQN